MRRSRSSAGPALAVGAVALLLAACGQPDPDVGAGSPAYGERHRPQFHFSPREMWMNEPNGLVYHDGEYHLFYQYHPDSTVRGPMHWGHAVSRDLVRWEHLPIALYPDELGYIFSGSAVVDWNDSSGFGVNGQPPLVAIYTYHDPDGPDSGATDYQTQGIAYSNDRGRSFTKFDSNPVIPNRDERRDFRDPNVFWHAATERWVMALAAGDRILFYASPDLKTWQFLSEFGEGWGSHVGVWECPDLFPLPVEGSDDERWVLLVNTNAGGPAGGSGTQYFVGDFDGRTFTLEPGFAATLREQASVWLDYGRDNYAGVTWSDVPEADGRRLFIGWMSNRDYAQEVPTYPWRSAMTLPRSLHLRETAAGLRVFSRPVSELASLRGDGTRLHRTTFVGGSIVVAPTVDFSLTTTELVLEFTPGAAGRVGVELGNAAGERFRVGFDAAANEFFSDRLRAGQHGFSDKFATGVHRAPRLDDLPTVRMRIFFDVASMELFADDGATVMTDTFFPSEPFERLDIFSEVAESVLESGRVWHIDGIW